MTSDSASRRAAATELHSSSFARRASSPPPPPDLAVARRDLQPGTRIGEYELLRRLGVGGMGTVWEAMQQSLQRRVALKLIHPEQIDAQMIELFRREARAGGKLSHPGIVMVLATGDADGMHFIAQELVEGGHSLAAALAELRGIDPLPPGYHAEAAQFIAAVADALHVAHEAGVIHRDVKPHNVLIDAEGRPKVSDFGLAHLVDEQSLTGQSGIVGSVLYMSPEQASATRAGLDRRADVFSLGVVLYEMLTLQRPFEGDTPEQVLERVLHEDPVAPARLRSRVPADLSVICMKALEKRRELRYATMEEFAADLRRFLAHEPVLARPTGALRRAQKWTLRHPTAAASIGLGAAALIVISFLLAQTIAAKKDSDTSADAARKSEGRATLARADAEERAHELLRLSDDKLLRSLEARAAALWPAHPERAEALEQWLADADVLAKNLPQHEASLARLRTAERESPADASGAGPRVTGEERSWWVETLDSLVRNLRRFLDDDPRVGTRASVAQRLASARALGQRSLVDPAAEWDEARAFVGESATYGNLALAPQIGLVPLGPDADSGLWEFWQVETGERPVRNDATGKLTITPQTGVVLVLLPGGKFRMGAQRADAARPNYDPGAQVDETVHEVALAPFFLSKYEMTQGQWQRLANVNPSFFGPVRAAGADLPMHPVEQVTWEECRSILGRVGMKLPTEAQWEYAARGGTGTTWWSGVEPASLRTAANIADAAYLRGNRDAASAESWDDGESAPSAVGAFAANPFGLHDVIGNVWEWCEDEYVGYEHPARPGDGLRGTERPKLQADRCQRGGGFSTRAASTRSAFRARFLQDSRDNDLGVRPAKAIDP